MKKEPKPDVEFVPQTIEIHGKIYTPVSERVREAHVKNDKIDITTELLPIENQIVFKATVVTKKGTYTGYSAANPGKAIEKQSPYEVAETSAIGRALGFAGYGIVEGIASADEMKKAETNGDTPAPRYVSNDPATEKQLTMITKLLGSNLEAFEASKGSVANLTKSQASHVIETLLKRKEESTSQVPQEMAFETDTVEESEMDDEMKQIVEQL